MTEEDIEGITFAIDVLGDFCDAAPDEVTQEYKDAIYKLDKLLNRKEEEDE